MSEPKEILIAFPLEEELAAEIEAFSDKIKVSLHPARSGEEIPPEVWAKTEILYTLRAFPAPEQAPKLRWIQFLLAGVDKALAEPIAQQEGLLLTTMSGANAAQVAEHAVGMALALGHNLPGFFAQQTRSAWASDKAESYQPVELNASTVGIIGYGSIGRQIARLLQPFGAVVLATKSDVMHPQDTGYTPEGLGDPEGEFFTRLYPPQALRSMLRECDYAIVTVPLTDKTRGLIGAKQIAEMKPSAFLIDVSRGGVVDQDALLAALSENRLAGAALDVFPEEPLPTDSPLWGLPNVVVTPHVAGFSRDYNRRANALFLTNLERYLKKDPLFNLVNPHKGY